MYSRKEGWHRTSDIMSIHHFLRDIFSYFSWERRKGNSFPWKCSFSSSSSSSFLKDLRVPSFLASILACLRSHVPSSCWGFYFVWGISFHPIFHQNSISSCTVSCVVSVMMYMYEDHTVSPFLSLWQCVHMYILAAACMFLEKTQTHCCWTWVWGA